MAWKNIKQSSLADALLIAHRALTEWDDLLTLIHWQSIEKHLTDWHNSKQGERAYPPWMLFKALLLQSGYHLSDPQWEQQLARDWLFRRFVGISLDTPIPDHTRWWRFRQKISADGRLDYLLARLNTALARERRIMKTGQISSMDASVI